MEQLLRQITEPLPADDVLEVLTELFGVEVTEFMRRRHNSPLRAVAARSLMRYAGLSQRDVANLLKVGSGAAVCNQINRLPGKLAEERRMAGSGGGAGVGCGSVSNASERAVMFGASRVWT